MDASAWQSIIGDKFVQESSEDPIYDLNKVYTQESNVSTQSFDFQDALAIFNLFIQLNWTGPIPNIPYIAQNVDLVQQVDIQSLAELSVDNESAYSLTRHPAMLAYALKALEYLTIHTQVHSSIVWWRARALFIHQKLLDNPSVSLKDEIFNTMSLIKLSSKSGDTNDRRLHAYYYSELALIQTYYRQDNLALESLRMAQEFSGLNIVVTGMLGKRTRFQEQSFSQLVVLAKSDTNHQTQSCDNDANHSKVKGLLLDHDILLEKMTLDRADTEATQNLYTLDQCILLAICGNVKNNNPADGITTEQMQPYIGRVLENANNWTIHSMALLLRSRLESSKPKTVERAVLQIQALVDQIPLQEALVEERLKCFFQVAVPSIWELEAELAEKMMSLGVILTALEIYERLQMWDKVVICHMLTERKDKAETVLLRLLSDNPNDPKFLCLLGDVRHDPSLYWDAWEQSGYRYSRAMRSLGAHHWRANEFHLAIQCFQRALRINPLFEDAWFVCGCAALQMEDWDSALEAFFQCTRLDYENAEAWSNLATVYIRLKQKPEAYRALQQGLKHKYHSWKMWTNFMYLAVDLGCIDDAIHAFTRIVEERGDNVAAREDLVDVEILKLIITRSVHDKGNLSDSVSSINRLLRLIELITSKVTNQSQVWAVVAHFYAAIGDFSQTITCYRNSYNCVARDSYTSYEDFETACKAAQELVNAYRDYGNREQIAANGTMKSPCPDWHYQSRLVVRGLLGRGEDFENTQAYIQLQAIMGELAESLR